MSSLFMYSRRESYPYQPTTATRIGKVVAIYSPSPVELVRMFDEDYIILLWR